MRAMLKVAVVAGMVLGAAARPGWAAISWEHEGPKVKPRLIAEPAGLEPGKTTWIGVHFEIEPQWHIYWNGLNDTGFEPKVTWTLPEGLSAGEMLWPAPKRKVASGFILDHIYEDRVTLLVPIAVAADFAAQGPVELKAKLEWLVCQEACIPEEAEVKIALPVGAAKAPGADEAKLLAASRERMPRPIAELLKETKNRLDVEIAGEDAGVLIEVPGAKALRYYPLNGGSALKDPIDGAEADGPVLKIAVASSKGKGEQEPYFVVVSGVLEVERADGQRTWYRMEAKETERK